MPDNELSSHFAFVLHADVVGSTQLVRQHEHLAHQRIQSAFRDLSVTVARYGGKVIETRGDALVADFEKASDAVSAGLVFQISNAERNATFDDEFRPEVRVGIGMGEFVSADGTITGTGVVLAQRLEQLAAAGEVYIQGAVYEAIPKRFPFAFTDLGEQQVKGFGEPIKVFRASLEQGKEVPEPVLAPPTTGNRSTRQWIAIGALLFVIAVGGALFVTGSWNDPDYVEGTATPAATEPEKPSIAVLPFDNLSDDPKQNYFADGMSEDLITDLSKISALFVIARNSSFSYKGRQVDIRTVGEELGARYVVEGSVRREGDIVRINAQLIDAKTGGHMWAERYDGYLTNIFELQDKVTNQIVSSLAVTLSVEERATIERPLTANPKAYEIFLQGREHFFRFSKDEVETARDLFAEALELDPSFADVYANLAWTYWFEFSNAWSNDPEQSLTKAHELAKKAISLDDTIPLTHFVLGLVYRERKDFVAAMAQAEKAIRLDPNYANGRVLLSTVLYYTGKAEEGLEQIQEAMRLEPHHPHNYPFHEGQAYFILGQYDEAIRVFEHGLEMNPTSQRLRLWLAATYAQAGLLEDAAWEIDEVLLNDPGLSLSRIEKAYPFRYSADLENFTDALSHAGLQ